MEKKKKLLKFKVWKPVHLFKELQLEVATEGIPVS